MWQVPPRSGQYRPLGHSVLKCCCPAQSAPDGVDTNMEDSVEQGGGGVAGGPAHAPSALGRGSEEGAGIGGEHGWGGVAGGATHARSALGQGSEEAAGIDGEQDMEWGGPAQHMYSTADDAQVCP